MDVDGVGEDDLSCWEENSTPPGLDLYGGGSYGLDLNSQAVDVDEEVPFMELLGPYSVGASPLAAAGRGSPLAAAGHGGPPSTAGRGGPLPVAGRGGPRVAAGRASAASAARRGGASAVGGRGAGAVAGAASAASAGSFGAASARRAAAVASVGRASAASAPRRGSSTVSRSFRPPHPVLSQQPTEAMVEDDSQQHPEEEGTKDDEVFDKAEWTSAANNAAFCEICVDEIRAGNRNNGVMTQRGYKNIAVRYYEKTGLRHSRTQLKNRWEGLKRFYSFWLWALKQTGIGRTPSGGIDAPPKWWAKHTKNHAEWRKLKNGPPDNLMELEEMYECTVLQLQLHEMTTGRCASCGLWTAEK